MPPPRFPLPQARPLHRPLAPFSKITHLSTQHPSALHTHPHLQSRQLHRIRISNSDHHPLLQRQRQYATKSTADEKVEEITEMYECLFTPSLPKTKELKLTLSFSLFPVTRYATAKDEVTALLSPFPPTKTNPNPKFDIATEETDKKSVYAADDRAAAREELGKLQAAFEAAVKGEGGKEVRRRVGQRVRELERGVEALEERAIEEG
ncbi:MAG: hypothetical protein Q9219_007725 [cf. Caloplaca sp. 3 TL-2023]